MGQWLGKAGKGQKHSGGLGSYCTGKHVCRESLAILTLLPCSRLAPDNQLLLRLKKYRQQKLSCLESGQTVTYSAKTIGTDPFMEHAATFFKALLEVSSP